MDLRADDSHRNVCFECKMPGGVHLGNCSAVRSMHRPVVVDASAGVTEDVVRRIVKEELALVDPMVLRK